MLLLHVLGQPLLGASGAVDQFPLVAEEHVEITVVPLRRIGLPGAFDTAGRGVDTLPGAEGVLPAQTHLFKRRGFRFGADQLGIAGAMRLAEGVAAGDQRHGFFVVHRHAGEGFAHILAGSDRVRITVWPFGIDIDQAHLHRGQRVFQVTLAAVALVTQPFGFAAPVDVFFRFPDIFAAAGKTEGLEAHRFQGDVARQDHQIGPGDFVAILLFDRPQQAARLVEIAVVGPTVERGETLVAGAAAPAPVKGPVSAGAVPGHADEQTAIVAPVGRPPVLRTGHQRGEVFLERRVIEFLEFLGIVEPFFHRAGLAGMLVQDLEIQLLRPPVGIRLGADRRAGAAHRGEWALAFVAHESLLFV